MFALAPLHAAEVHRASTPDEFLVRVRSGLVQENLGRIVTDAMPVTQATKVFNISASSGSSSSSFKFTVSPSPFVVNQGDSVTLNISVPSNDQSTVGHGFLMENFFEDGVLIPRGQTRTVQFVANMVGPFTYICNQSSCGTGHTIMNGTFTVNALQAAPPTISSINPNTGSTGGGNIVTITGTNFNNSPGVTFDTSPAIGVSVNGTTSITATAPAHAAGTVTVTVTNNDGQTATTSYIYANPTLSITAVSPNTGSTAGGTAVTITGANFQTGATATFGALPATNVNVVNATTMTATTPLGPATEQLAVDVTVKNPDGKSATQTHAFTYTLPTPPTVTDVSANSGTTVGGALVTISGTGFTTALSSSVTFGGVPATSFTVLNSVTLLAVTPAHAAGATDVVVRMGNNSVTKTGGYTFVTIVAPPRRHATRH
jgi:hypothetical protein